MSNIDGCFHVPMLALCSRLGLDVVSGVMILMHALGLESL